MGQSFTHPSASTFSYQGEDNHFIKAFIYMALWSQKPTTSVTLVSLWNKHITNVTVKGNSTVGFIQRKILTNSEAVKNLAYKQLVCQVLEYASAAFDSASNTGISQLEAGQRGAARLTCGIIRTDGRTSITCLLRKLDLKSLGERFGDEDWKYSVSVMTQTRQLSTIKCREPTFSRLENMCGNTSFHISTPSSTNGHFLPVLARTRMLCWYTVRLANTHTIGVRFTQLPHFSHLWS